MTQKILLLVGIGALLTSCTPQAGVEVASNDTASNDPAYIQDLRAVPSEISGQDGFMQCISSAVNNCTQNTASTVARNSKDTSICDKLATDDAKQACIYGTVLTMALEAGDPASCDAISNPQYHAHCGMEVYRQLALSSGDASQCNKITETTDTGSDVNIGTDSVDQCILAVVSANPNAETADCDAISSDTLKVNCQYMIESQKAMRATRPPAPTPSN
jgi:hypothetical protein